MLKQYYDINMADRFEELFGGLYIGENPTPGTNTYLNHSAQLCRGRCQS